MRAASNTRALVSVAVLLVTALAAWHRVFALDHPGLWLDEILAVLRAQASPLSTSWTPGPDPQHGPLYHAILFAADRMSTRDGAYRLPFAVLGTLTVPLLFRFAADCGGFGAGILAASLLAVSPQHVYLSREARPYGLLLFLFVAALLAASRQRDNSAHAAWRWTFAGCTIGLILSSSQGIWFVLVAAVVYAILLWSRTALFTVAGAFAAASLVFGVVHGHLLLQSPDVIGAPPLTSQLVGGMLNALITGLPETEAPTREVAVILAWAMASGMILLAARPRHGFALLAGVLVAFAAPFVLLTIANHGIRGRYTLAALPLLIAIVSAGTALLVAALANRVHRPAAHWAPVLVCTAVAVLVGRFATPSIARAEAYKPDWRAAAQVIAARARPNDLVVASNDWPRVCLSWHLPRVEARVRLVSAEESVDRAKQLAAGEPVAFFVAGGWHRTSDILRWLDTLPELFWHRNDTLRVHCGPDLAACLLRRPAPGDVAGRAEVLRRVQGLVVPGPNAAPLLLHGWGDEETNRHGVRFRWIQGRAAQVYVPVQPDAPARLEIEGWPFAPLADVLSVEVRLNDTVLASFAGADLSKRQSIDVGMAPWQPGGNLVEVRVSHARRPVDVLPGAADPRELGFAVSHLAIR